MPEILTPESVTKDNPTLKFTPISKSDVEKKAKELKDSRALPPPPGKSLDLSTTLEYLSLLTPEHWQRISVYLYRTYPIINREPKYLEIYSQPFTLDQIKDSYGGGRYKLQIKDSYKGYKAEDDAFFVCYFDISDNEYDPIINLDELEIENNKNRRYIDKLKLKGVLDSQGRIKSKVTQIENNENANGMVMTMFRDMLTQYMSRDKEQQNAIRNGMKTDDSAVAKALELVQKSGETGIQMVMERFKTEDPTKMFSLMIQMMDKFKPTPDDGSKDKMFMMMITMMQESNKTQINMMQENTRIMMEMLKPKEGEGKEEVDEFDKLEKIFKIASMIGLKKGNPLDEGGGWVDKVVELAPTVLNTIGNVIGAIMMNKNGGMVPGVPIPNQVPNPNIPMQPQMEQPSGYLGNGINNNPPDTITLNPNSNPKVVQMGSQQNQPQIHIPPGMNQDQVNQLLTYSGFIQNALAQKIRGHIFAESVITMITEPKYLEIRAVGEEPILATLKSVPIVWDRLKIYGEENVKQFVHDFVFMEEAFKLDEMSEEGEEGEED